MNVGERVLRRPVLSWYESPGIINRCVCFLCVEDTRTQPPRYRYSGTAFFVQVQQAPGIRFPYLVTAKHCVERASEYGGLKVRLNLRNRQGARVLDLDTGWFYHENPSSDVVVMPPCIPSEDFDYAVIDTALFAVNDVILDNHIGVGDELFISGLFTQRHGTTRNIPIIRTGVIASMPEEPLIDDGGNPYHAYLAEVRSIGGLSGSPVFVYLEAMRLTDTAAPDLTNPEIFLLGVIRGHWDFETSAGHVDFSGQQETLNMGIATVTPIAELLDILMSKELLKARQAVEAEQRNKERTHSRQQMS